MFGIHDLWLFVVAGLLLNVTPGADTAYIVGRSVQMGWRGGAVAALGISAGCLVHVLGATIGLSALLVSSSTAFAVVKLLGAVYLLVTGLRMVFTRPATLPAAGIVAARALRQVFWQGMLTNALNPKVAMFFLAFLPQFVAADAPHQALAFLLLGSVFVVNGTLWCLGVAAVAAKTAGRIRSSGRVQLWMNRLLGGVLVALGIRVALLDPR